MRFSELVNAATELLTTTGKISYRAPRREFELDDETRDDLKHELRVGANTGEVLVRSIRKDDLHTDDVPVGIRTISRRESGQAHREGIGRVTSPANRSDGETTELRH